MAQRFGGKFSPGDDSASKTGAPKTAAPERGAGLAHARPARVGARVNLLFLMPFVFAFTAFTQGAVGLGLDLAAFVTLILAAWLTREGELAHEAYDARSVARRPAFPRKGFAAVLTGIGLGLGTFIPSEGIAAPLILGVIGAVLHFVAFGPDPMRDKGMEGVDRTQTERVARAVDEAEKHIAAMKDAVLRASDRDLIARVDRFANTARAMFRSVESDPRDLTAARRYLSVYLEGARDATVRFADLYGRRRDPQVRADYAALLDDLDSRFAQRTETLLGNDRTSLDVEIEVLRERLALDAPHT
ncbi:MAG: 5-bromo-4-chloroindolyl phosphate hydrolysis family protein [Gemmobacter sp.]|nr:5-bromo-4-chloroindolyl phosphate hydrolysis family protein [Gemmobacter sp.]